MESRARRSGKAILCIEHPQNKLRESRHRRKTNRNIEHSLSEFIHPVSRPIVALIGTVSCVAHAPMSDGLMTIPLLATTSSRIRRPRLSASTSAAVAIPNLSIAGSKLRTISGSILFALAYLNGQVRDRCVRVRIQLGRPVGLPPTSFLLLPFPGSAGLTTWFNDLGVLPRQCS